VAVPGSRWSLFQGRVKTRVLTASGGEPDMCGDSRRAGVTVHIIDSQVASVAQSMHYFAVPFVNRPSDCSHDDTLFMCI